MNPRIHIKAYSQKVKEPVNAAINAGKVSVSVNVPIQRLSVATAIPCPLMEFGKISDRTTHVTGASPAEYDATARSEKVSSI